MKFVRLKELGEIITGNTPKTSEFQNYESDDICFVKPSDIDDKSISKLKNSEYYISEYARKSARIAPKNSILVTCIGIIGKIAILEDECAFNQQINAIITDEKQIYPLYLAYNLFFQKKYLQQKAKAPVVPIINKTDFGDFKVKLHNLIEQQKIVDILDKVENLIDNRQQQLNLLDELIKSRFIEMFGDPVTNPMNWNIQSMLELGEFKNGMNFHNGDNSIDVHCLGVGDFKNLSVISNTSYLPEISLNEKPTNEYILRNNDVVFVRSNGNKNLVGRCVLVYPNDVLTIFSGFCIRFRLLNIKYIVPMYLLQVLKHESMRRKMLGRGVNIQNLNQQILSKLCIPTPPVELQNKFAAFVEQTEKTKSTIKKSLDELNLLKDSLMQKYFG